MKSSPFQIILIAVFSFFILITFVVLYFTKANNKSDNLTKVSLWGTVPAEYVLPAMGSLNPEKNGLEPSYREISADAFDQTLIEALANGNGPDAIIIPQDSIVRYWKKIYPIPYQSLSQRTFKDTYVTEAELFLESNGVLAVPFSIDPLIMYWNRDLFSNAGLANPPRYWDEFLRLAESLTVKGDSVTVKKSAAPLGEFSNVTNAKEIISAMTLQTGAPITAFSEAKLVPSLSGANNRGLQNVIDFYTEFANPVKSVYTWNRSLPNSLAMFAEGSLGTYFGFAGEMSSIKSKNPNLDFDIGYFPESRSAQTKITYGKVFGVAALRSSQKVQSAMQLALLMGSAVGVRAYSAASGLPPVRRDLLSSVPNDAYGAILYNSALWSRGWYDPDSVRTKVLFRDMIEAVTSGWMKSEEAVGKFNSQMNLLLSGQ